MFLKILFIVLFFIISTAIIYALVFLYKNFVKSEDEVTVLSESYDFSIKQTKKIDSALKAQVLCNPNKTFEIKKFKYTGQKDCNLFKKFYDSDVLCPYMCYGFGSCRNACPENAIIIRKNTAFIKDSCNACGKCLNSCPNNLIKIYNKTENQPILCAAQGTISNCSKCGVSINE